MKKIILIFTLLFNIVCIAQEDKTVTLTVSGTGKTLEEARLNALRSAIEQAFGAFISSKTEILNDNLVKDEIVSVANGNIQKYDIKSQMEIPNSGFAITLSATVSISKLTTFAESKGVTVEYKGGVFAANIKLQQLNEYSEFGAIYNLYGLMHEKFQTIFEYTLEAKNPVLNLDKINYNIPVTVIANANNTYNETILFLIETLKALSLKDNEVLDYENLNKTVYKVSINYENENYNIFLRSLYSYQWLQTFAKSWKFYIGNYSVNNGVNLIEGPGGFSFQGSDSDIRLYPRPSQPFILRLGFENSIWNSEFDSVQAFENGKIFSQKIYFNDFQQTVVQNSVDNKFNLELPSKNSQIAKFEFVDIKSLMEIEKITEYSVKSSGIISKFKYGGYVIHEQNGHGIIACPYFLQTNNNWGNSDKFLNTESKLYSGKLNTDKISKNSENNIGKDCSKFNVLGYNDWVIPSSDELELLFNKLYSTGILFNNVKNLKIISSTEAANDNIYGNRLKSYNFHDYIYKLTENNLNNKEFSFKNIVNNTFYISTSTNQVETRTIIPIRYF